MRVFPSKRDGWLVVVLLLGMAMLVAGAVITWRVEAPLVLRFAMTAIAIVASLFMLWTLGGTAYLVDGADLEIRSGPFGWVIPIADITSVTPTRSPLSSPALSLDRLEIEWRGGRAIRVSPVDKHGFLAALADASPGLVVDGERAVRRRE